MILGAGGGMAGLGLGFKIKQLLQVRSLLISAKIQLVKFPVITSWKEKHSKIYHQMRRFLFEM